MLASAALWAGPSPELPGIDIRDLPPAWGDTIAHVSKPHKEIPASGAIGAWSAPSIEEQLEADEVLLGIGEGAVFVPSMTHGRVEPRVSILDQRGKVAALGGTGKRIRLQPGSYRIRFGSGSEDQRMDIPVEVHDGETTVPPIPWCGLTVTTITPERQHFRGEYKLVRSDRFQGYGEGFGQPEDRLADLPTWILPPGVYKLTGLASGTNDLTNFVTVRLIAGEWVEYTLVMDDDKVVGGGSITEVAIDNRRDLWRFGADLGGSLTWTREKLARQSNLRTTTNLTGVTQLRARKETDTWLTSVRLQFVGGAAMVGSDGWKVAPDEISTQLFTVRRVTPRVGPYGRLVGTSHLFPADIDLSSTTDPLRLYVRDPEDGKLYRREEGGQKWEYAAPLSPLELREGLGLNIEAIQLPALEVSLQVGLASRQIFPFGAYYQKDLGNPSLQLELSGVDSLADITNTIVMEEAAFEHGTGFEATGDLRARLGSSTSLTVSPGAFWSVWPRDRMELSVTSVLSLHLTRFMTADLRYTVKRSLEEEVIHRYPYSLQTLLRFSFGA